MNEQVSLVSRIQASIGKDACIRRCNKDGCGVSLGKTRLTEHAFFDFDRIPHKDTGKRCDCLFVGEKDETLWIMLIELKKGKFKRDAVEQLRHSVSTLDDLLPRDVSFEFVPVVAHGKIHQRDQQILRKAVLTLRGKQRRIETMRCGGTLQTIFGTDHANP